MDSKDNSKIKIAVHTQIENTEMYGGVMVLHKLKDILISLGYDAFSVHQNSDNLNRIDENTIVVYSENVPGNPFNAKHIVRYVMYYKDVNVYDKNDFIIYYDECFKKELAIGYNEYTVRIYDTDLDFWKNHNKNRNGSCYSYRKNTNVEKILHEQDSIQINYHTSFGELLGLFNTKKRFYCYDNNTFLAAFSTLCGCETIVDKIPHEFGNYINDEKGMREYIQNQLVLQEENCKKIFSDIASKVTIKK